VFYSNALIKSTPSTALQRRAKRTRDLFLYFFGGRLGGGLGGGALCLLNGRADRGAHGILRVARHSSEQQEKERKWMSLDLQTGWVCVA